MQSTKQGQSCAFFHLALTSLIDWIIIATITNGKATGASSTNNNVLPDIVKFLLLYITRISLAIVIVYIAIKYVVIILIPYNVLRWEYCSIKCNKLQAKVFYTPINKLFQVGLRYQQFRLYSLQCKVYHWFSMNEPSRATSQ